MTILTNTALGTYRLCPRKYRNRYLYRLVRARRAVALRFGSAFHAGLDMFNKGSPSMVVLAWLKSAYDICPDWAEPADWQVEYQTLRQLLEAHFWRYSKDNLELMASETTFSIPLVDPATQLVSELFSLAGKIDAIVRMDDGRLALLEYKTAGEDIGPNSDYWQRLHADSQLSLYILAARAAGYDVSTCLYDVTRKPTIRCKKTETPEQYSTRLYEDINERPEYYFQRREIPTLEDELREFQVELWQQICALQDSMAHGRWYRNINRMTCAYCEYSELCFNNIHVDPGQTPLGFEIIADPHPELSA
ncbi:MAG: PD-(D/E)XK nuclease family protein [Planctomycetaceae bacterium]|nr:PD-(D/E)XK nuclease family protein [Planctomycetaceae bacterium]